MNQRVDRADVERALADLYAAGDPHPSEIERMEEMMGKHMQRTPSLIERFIGRRPSLPRFPDAPRALRLALESSVVVIPILILGVVLWRTGLHQDPASTPDPMPGSAEITPSAEPVLADSAIVETDGALLPTDPLRRELSAPIEQVFETVIDGSTVPVTVTVASVLADSNGTIVMVVATVPEGAVAPPERYPGPQDEASGADEARAPAVIDLGSLGQLDGVHDPALRYLPRHRRGERQLVAPYRFPPLPETVDSFVLEVDELVDAPIPIADPWRMEIALRPFDESVAQAHAASFEPLIGVNAVFAGISITATHVAYGPDETVVRLLLAPHGWSLTDHTMSSLSGESYVLPMLAPTMEMVTGMYATGGRLVGQADDGVPSYAQVLQQPVVVSKDLGQAALPWDQLVPVPEDRRRSPEPRMYNGEPDTAPLVASRPIDSVPGADAARDGTTWYVTVGGPVRDDDVSLEILGVALMHVAAATPPITIDFDEAGRAACSHVHPVEAQLDFGFVGFDIDGVAFDPDGAEIFRDDLDFESPAGWPALIGVEAFFDGCEGVAYLNEMLPGGTSYPKQIYLWPVAAGDFGSDLVSATSLSGRRSFRPVLTAQMRGAWLLRWNTSTGRSDARTGGHDHWTVGGGVTTIDPSSGIMDVEVTAPDSSGSSAANASDTVRVTMDPFTRVRSSDGTGGSLDEIGVGHGVRVDGYRLASSPDTVVALEIVDYGLPPR